MRLHLIGTRGNRNAVGSRITVQFGKRTAVQQIKGGGSYLSASELRQVFAVKPGEVDIRVEIRWPDGSPSVLDNIGPSGDYVVIEPREPAGKALVFRRDSRISKFDSRNPKRIQEQKSKKG